MEVPLSTEQLGELIPLSRHTKTRISLRSTEAGISAMSATVSSAFRDKDLAIDRKRKSSSQLVDGCLFKRSHTLRLDTDATDNQQRVEGRTNGTSIFVISIE